LGSGESEDWLEPEAEPRDWKKIVLVAGLGILSWVATYVGMLELIEANLGELPLVHKVIIGFSVAMLMTMIIWLLDKLFAPIGLFTKTLYAAGYLFLTVISIAFGFGFYWKVLESRSEASRSAESAIGQVQGALFAASTRLDQLQTTLVTLRAVSAQKAESERASGNTCPGSRPGDGPRRKLRDDDAARFAFASDFVRSRATQVKADMRALDGELARIVKDDKSTVDARTGTRNEFMKGVGRKLDLTVTGFNAFRTDPQLKQIRADLAERADKTTFPDSKGGTYSCPDPQLQTALRGVVRAIEQLPEIEKPKIAAVEGSEATIEAFRRLTTTFYGLLAFKLPPSAEELRILQQKAVQSVEGAAHGQRAAPIEQAGLSKRDYVPLAIAIFVDICLFLVSMGRPMNRLNNLIPKMREAERGPIYQILSRFTEIHGDADIRQKFEIFRHVVFDFHGDYYVAIPLDAPPRANPAERRELQLEAHLLSNLFSSFERERIFSRVYAPLLSSRAIRKKLWRQGSKFSGSEAFRIYKFKNGAWSDIILGAVMGAARRVEAEKRRRRADWERHLAEASGRGDAPAFAPTLVPRPNVLPFPHAAGRAGIAYAPYPVPAAGAHQPQPHAHPADPDLVAAFGEYARYQQEHERRARVAVAAAQPGLPQYTTPPALTTAMSETSPGPMAKNGAARRMEEPQPAPEPMPAVAAATNPGPPADVEPARVMAVIEPERRAASAGPPPLPAQWVQEQPRPAPEMVEAPGVGVELRERTMRFTVPSTSPAALPDTLQARHGATQGVVAAPAEVLPAPSAGGEAIAHPATVPPSLPREDVSEPPADGKEIDVEAIARNFAAGGSTQ
jgi:hypothetical protein